jgi:hypothetical protein
MNLGKRTTGNVKVISFPEGFTSRVNQSPFVMREEWHVIVLEDEAGNISRLPEVCCKQVLQEGMWYHMFQTNAIMYPKYHFQFLEEKNYGHKKTKQQDRNPPPNLPQGRLPRTEKRIVTVIEQPTEENWDNYVVRLSDKTTVKVDYSIAQSFFAIGDKAKVEFRIDKDGRSIQSMKPIKPSQYKETPLPLYDIRRSRKGVEVSNGYRWATLEDALNQSWASLEECGKHIGTKRICNGAIGSAMEYTINMYLWKVEHVYVLDLKDEGEGYEVYKSRKAVDARMREIREQGGAY